MPINRLVKGPLVGALVGAIEGGFMFRTLTVIDSRSGPWLGGNEDTIMVGFIIGLILGTGLGGIVGLIIALMRARPMAGFLIGAAAGVLIAFLILVTGTMDDDIYTMLAMLTVPCLASIGLISAVLTAPGFKGQSG